MADGAGWTRGSNDRRTAPWKTPRTRDARASGSGRPPQTRRAATSRAPDAETAWLPDGGDHLLGLFDRDAARVSGTDLAVSAVAGALTGCEKRRHEIDGRVAAPPRRERRADFGGGEAVGGDAAGLPEVLADQGAHTI